MTPWAVARQLPLSRRFPSKSTGVGNHFLLQGIFPTQGSKPGLLHCRWLLYHLSHQGSPLPHYQVMPSLKPSSIFSLHLNKKLNFPWPTRHHKSGLCFPSDLCLYYATLPPALRPTLPGRGPWERTWPLPESSSPYLEQPLCGHCPPPLLSHHPITLCW